jgi:hypothetical protein
MGNVGSLTLENPFTTTPTDASAASTDVSGDTSWLSGLAGIFSSVGTAIGSTYRAINTPTTPIAPVYNPATGTYQVFNPSTGQYSVQPAPTTIAGISPNTLLLIGGAILLIVLLKK